MFFMREKAIPHGCVCACGCVSETVSALFQMEATLKYLFSSV